MLALAGHVQTGFPQGGDHRLPVLDGPGLDALTEVVGDDPPGILCGGKAGAAQVGVDAGLMPRFIVPRPCRIVRAAPVVLVVLPVPEGIEGLLPAGGSDVQTLTRLQIDPRREHMEMDPAVALPVLNGAPGVAVGFQPGPGRLLELVEHLPDLRVGRIIARSPGDHGGRALVLEAQGVGQLLHLEGVASQHLHALPLPALAVLRAGQVGGAPAAAEANHHRPGPPRRRTLGSPAARRSGGLRPEPPLPPLWVLAQRAIWFRLFPIRANCRSRSRSSSAWATVKSYAQNYRASRFLFSRPASVGSFAIRKPLWRGLPSTKSKTAAPRAPGKTTGNATAPATIWRKVGRPPGKKSNPDYTQVTVYLRTRTHLAAKKSLLDEGREFSELVEDLVARWIQR